jgi:acetyltransferase-like isoleucine patch superfamily enzyme
MGPADDSGVGRRRATPAPAGRTRRSRLGLTGSGPGDVLRLAQTLKGHLFSRWIGPGFARFGPHSVVRPPLRLFGEGHIEVGPHVFIGPDCWLQALGPPDEAPTQIVIGEGSSLVGGTVISALQRVELGRHVLVARNAYLADHSHETSDPSVPVLAQGLTEPDPIVIGDGSWLGQNVVVLPGTTLGPGSVVGANSVVGGTHPARSLLVGAPARLVRRLPGADD